MNIVGIPPAFATLPTVLISHWDTALMIALYDYAVMEINNMTAGSFRSSLLVSIMRGFETVGRHHIVGNALASK